MEYKNRTEICGTLKWEPRLGQGKNGPYCYFGVSATVDGKTLVMECAAYDKVADAMQGLQKDDWVDCVGQLGAAKDKDGNWGKKLYVKQIGTFPPVNRASNQTVVDDEAPF